MNYIVQISTGVNAFVKDVDACSSAARMTSWGYEETQQRIIKKLTEREKNTIGNFLQMSTSSRDMQTHE